MFVSIMGHFVHPFDRMVSASSFDQLESTGCEFISQNMSLQQLRKGKCYVNIFPNPNFPGNLVD